VQILNFGRLWAFEGEDETVKKIPSLEKLFKGRHFERDIIVSCACVGTLISTAAQKPTSNNSYNCYAN
jgi:hypothetical protein